MPLKRYHATGELNFEVDDKDAKIEEIVRKFATGKVDRLDGVTVEFNDWWFNVRKSNTEPLLRLNLEGRNSRTHGKREKDARKYYPGKTALILLISQRSPRPLR